MACAEVSNPAGAQKSEWLAGLLSPHLDSPPGPAAPCLQLVRQDYEQLEINRSVIKTPLRIGSRAFGHGLGTHSVSHIRLFSPDPITRFSAWIGVDANDHTRDGAGSVVFSVSAGRRELFRSGILRGGGEPQQVAVEVSGVNTLDLLVGDAGDGPSCDHADWAEATITTRDGKTTRLDELPRGMIPEPASRYPFSFVYDGKPSDDLLDHWQRTDAETRLDADRTRQDVTWTDAATGLRLHWEITRFGDFPAVEWVLYLENTGAKDTPIIEDLQALDAVVRSPLGAGGPYLLHHNNGAPANPSDFEQSETVINSQRSVVLGGGGGRSSNKDLPFFKLDTGAGATIVAVGWSGQWQATVSCADDSQAHLVAGLERTHFRLHPGEQVRSPRMLLLHWHGDTLESNAQFRQLIYKHYAATRSGKKPLPTPFCNTCFTRGGGWLNECTAENQISLIRAYAKLGLEALLTDAGWFEGGWPAGAGNWTPRKDAYPQGMGPVAAAAKDNGMVYGLWFEPERVVAGTWLHQHHPEWLLPAGPEPQGTYLLNFGLPEVQDYFFGIVKGFMDLPGFRVYRQDFNMDPLPHWRYNEPPDRQGIVEMKYVAGLYAYWDRIATTWPDSLREECASGGRRIDLETVKRMHMHQKSDYWFDDDVEQATIWSLSQYLPNNVFVAPTNRTDDYSFRSDMATSLCLGWIADAPDFDTARGKTLLGKYLALRHLLIGAWYPLTGYSRGGRDWIASQYHRPDLGEGMILAFRRANSVYRTAEVALHGLDAQATYELTSDNTGASTRATGAELMKQYLITLPQKHQSELITYRKVKP